MAQLAWTRLEYSNFKTNELSHYVRTHLLNIFDLCEALRHVATAAKVEVRGASDQRRGSQALAIVVCSLKLVCGGGVVGLGMVAEVRLGVERWVLGGGPGYPTHAPRRASA